MLPPRSIPAFAPPLDRLVVRAALAQRAEWPRSGEALARLVGAAAQRDPEHASWVPDPEAALVAALAAQRDGPPVVACPEWGVEAFAAPLGRAADRLIYMPPAAGRMDPGPAEVRRALDDGATAVLLAPVAGDCVGIQAIAALCADRGVTLALDARMASGGRVLDGPPGAWGDPTLLAVHGEPGPAPCPGAVLLASRSTPPQEVRANGGSFRLALRLLHDSLRSEPRLRRLLGPSASAAPTRTDLSAPSWAFAAAAARLQQSADRASQRARHGRTLRSNIAYVDGMAVLDEPPGVQSASCVLPLLSAHRDAVAAALDAAGIPTLQAIAGWLAPAAERSDPAADVAARALFLPLHPFYRPQDLVAIGEALRRAALGAQDGPSPPTG